MIITTSEEWTNLYRSILEESTRSDEKHVFIYASSSDADSVCALRILEVRPALLPRPALYSKWRGWCALFLCRH